MTTEAWTTKAKTDKWDQTKKLLDREGNNQQNEKVNSENGWKYLKTIITSRYLKKCKSLKTL